MGNLIHFKAMVSRLPMSSMAKENEYQGTLTWMLSDASSYQVGQLYLSMAEELVGKL